ncbi:hypothetical protein HNY73_003061 [Argiope bruennichi]|uniref:Uncharacterized protein n=1 Tax=Argiope bruennichi TaxID=94029 RepID=A0A8T0FWT8_ARGBR|nr:hypothetical protein HNY73_003061 [Argiope bruennichi]
MFPFRTTTCFLFCIALQICVISSLKSNRSKIITEENDDCPITTKNDSPEVFWVILMTFLMSATLFVVCFVLARISIKK